MKTLVPAAVIAFLAFPLTASADHRDSPLSIATCTYRDAVKEFERGVFRADLYHPHDERRVARLENLSCDLRSAARSGNVDRILETWANIQFLERQVQTSLFRSCHYPRHPRLYECWQSVCRASECVAREIAAIQGPAFPPVPHRERTLEIQPSIDRSPIRYIPRDYQVVPQQRVPEPFGRSPFGYDSYRQPFPTHRDLDHHRGLDDHRSIDYRSRNFQRRPERVITFPQRVEVPVDPTHRAVNRSVEVQRRDLGRAVIGALLSRALN